MFAWSFEKYNFTFLNITASLIRKGFSIGKLWNSWWSVQNFLKSNFHLNCQIFSLAATTIICFIWRIGSFQLFFNIYLQNNCMNKHSFFFFFSLSFFSAWFSPLTKTIFVLWLLINLTGIQNPEHNLTFLMTWEKVQTQGDFKSVDPKPTVDSVRFRSHCLLGSSNRFWKEMPI